MAKMADLAAWEEEWEVLVAADKAVSEAQWAAVAVAAPAVPAD